MFRFSPVLFALIAAISLASMKVHAIEPLREEFDSVDVKNKLGEKLDLTIPLMSRAGKNLSLGDALTGDKPVLLTMNYYRCTSLCSVQLNELMSSMAQMGWLPGEEGYRVVTISFDPSDTPEVADGKRETYTRELVRKSLEVHGSELTDGEVAARADALDWEFYVASDEAIKALSDTLGYYFRYDDKSKQYAHSPVVYVLRPDGTINRYLFGLQIPQRDLKFALMETSEGKLGSFGEKILLSCFAYDGEGGYGAFAWGFMRIGGGVAAVILSFFLIRAWRRERARRLTASV